MITGVAKVVVSVDDQERAKQFWTGAIGFDAVMDESYGDERWIGSRARSLARAGAEPPSQRRAEASRARRAAALERVLHVRGHRADLR